MKLTKTQLREIIREEIQKLNEFTVIDIAPGQRKYFDQMNDVYFEFLRTLAKNDGKSTGKLSNNDLDNLYGDTVKKKYNLKGKKYSDMAQELIDKKVIKLK
jgi:hypothetical protein